MRRMLRLGSVVLCVAGVLVGSGGPAAAAPNGRIIAITTGEGTVDMVFQASELPPGQSVDAASVRVEVDGVEVPATAKPLGGGAKPVSRTAVLVMDVSGSMQGDGIAGAKKAAAAFLAAVPADVRVGLVTFGNTARVAVAPTTDRGRSRRRGGQADGQWQHRALRRHHPRRHDGRYDGAAHRAAPQRRGRRGQRGKAADRGRHRQGLEGHAGRGVLRRH